MSELRPFFFVGDCSFGGVSHLLFLSQRVGGYGPTKLGNDSNRAIFLE